MFYRDAFTFTPKGRRGYNIPILGGVTLIYFEFHPRFGKEGHYISKTLRESLAVRAEVKYNSVE